MDQTSRQAAIPPLAPRRPTPTEVLRTMLRPRISMDGHSLDLMPAATDLEAERRLAQNLVAENLVAERP